MNAYNKTDSKDRTNTEQTYISEMTSGEGADDITDPAGGDETGMGDNLL